MITIVSGFQCCGSSLMLQMLDVGGMRVFHDPDMGYPSFESMLQVRRASDERWLLPLDGQALKWLEPQRAMPPALPHQLRILWMARNYGEQAKSAAKFMAAVGGLVISAKQRRVFESSYRRDTAKAVRLWQARGAVRVVTFERLLEDPRAVAQGVSEFLKVALDLDAMARQVRRRSPACLPYMLEERLIAERDGRSPALVRRAVTA